MFNRFTKNAAAFMLATFVMLNLCVIAQAAAYRVEGKCVRESAIYKQNETIKFIASVIDEEGKPVTDQEVKFIITKDGYSVIEQGVYKSTTKPKAFTAKLNEPGFVRIEVMVKRNDKFKMTRSDLRLGAGVEPLSIPASHDLPKDFKAFWQEKTKTVHAVPMKPEFTDVKTQVSGVKVVDLKIATPGSKTSTAPLTGYYAKPENAKAGSCPAILLPHSAGVRSSYLHLAAAYAEKGFIALDFNAHGLPNGKPSSFYQEQSKGPLNSYPGMGKTDREDSYFTGMYMRLIRALQFIKAQPEWNGKILVVRGSSQGGGQALVAGGLDPDVTLVAASVPAMCDHAGYNFEKMVGWPRLASWTAPAAKNERYKKIVKAGQYVDAANFSKLIEGQVLISVGFADHVCCPTSVYTAFNNIPHQNKQIINRPAMGHSFPQDLQTEFDKIIDQHVKAKR
ncbi:acetylxylan esterase [Planctomycetota bacterium]|nr:acetylxylan esterase [Planctomycetota bacterium]